MKINTYINFTIKENILKACSHGENALTFFCAVQFLVNVVYFTTPLYESDFNVTLTMNEEHLSSSSDSEDADYVPVDVGVDANSSGGSGSEISSDEEFQDDEEESSTKISQTKRKEKRIKLSKDKKNEPNDDTDKLNVDYLWEEFKRSAHVLSNQCSVLGYFDKKTNANNKLDVHNFNVETQQYGEISKNNNDNCLINTTNNGNDDTTTTSNNTNLSTNGKLSCSDEVIHNRRPKVAGLAAVINQLEKKNKLNILDKSKSDWNSFKSKEGISSNIEAYNKGKRGYLGRQDFLKRTDVRRFEIEKAARSKRRGRQPLRV